MKGHIYRKRRPDGSWSRWYAVLDLPRSPGGKRRQRTTTHDTRKEAQAWLARTAQEYQSGEVYDTQVTVAAYLESWLAGKQGLRPSTRLSYRTHLGSYLLPHLGHLRLADLRAHHVEEMYRAIVAGNERRERPVNVTTLHRVHATLRSALNTAVRRGLIRRNPAATVELPAPVPNRPRSWTPAEAAQFLEVVKDDQLHCLYRVLLVTGLRRGEAIGLRWQDVDLDEGLLTVRQQLVAVGPDLVEGPPKSSSGVRTIVLDEATVSALSLQALESSFARPVTGPDLVFQRNGGPVPPAYVSRHFDRLVAAAGLPRIRLHDLRHTSASLGLASGETLVEVSKRLGHSTIALTADTYTHVDTETARESSQRLARYIDRAPAAQGRDQ